MAFRNTEQFLSDNSSVWSRVSTDKVFCIDFAESDCHSTEGEPFVTFNNIKKFFFLDKQLVWSRASKSKDLISKVPSYKKVDLEKRVNKLDYQHKRQNNSQP